MEGSTNLRNILQDPGGSGDIRRSGGASIKTLCCSGLEVLITKSSSH